MTPLRDFLRAYIGGTSSADEGFQLYGVRRKAFARMHLRAFADFHRETDLLI